MRELKACQRYHIKHGAITGLFSGAMPWWTYRRILAVSNFEDPRITSDLAMINTAGNDYYGGNVIGDRGTGGRGDGENNSERETGAAETLARARRASLGYLYWLQTECEREAADVEAAPTPVTVFAPSAPSPYSLLQGEGNALQLPELTPNTEHPIPNTQYLTKGYPEFRLRQDVFDTEYGCSPRPYIRESGAASGLCDLCWSRRLL